MRLRGRRDAVDSRPAFPAVLRSFLISLFAGLALLTPDARAADFSVREQPAPGEYVVLIHGLDWFRDTLEPTEKYLHRQGYHTICLRYPSREIADVHTVTKWASEEIAAHCSAGKKPVNLVGHSMGGLIVRDLLSTPQPWPLGRVVLMGAPNQGTPLVKPLRWKALRKILGTAVAQLAEGGDALPARLGAAAFAPGVIMGSRSGWFPYLSPFLPGPDDGVVPVSSGRLDGMADFRVVRASHTGMPANAAVLRETARFLKTGRFSPASPTPQGTSADS